MPKGKGYTTSHLPKKKGTSMHEDDNKKIRSAKKASRFLKGSK